MGRFDERPPSRPTRRRRRAAEMPPKLSPVDGYGMRHVALRREREVAAEPCLRHVAPKARLRRDIEWQRQL